MKLPRKKAKARIEMMPLMDIVFLLLVFFIYAMMSMAIHKALPLKLPSSSAAEPERQVSLALMVRADGLLLLDKEPVILEKLAFILQERRKQEEEPERMSLQIFADDTLSYQELFRVLDQVKMAGLKKVSLQAAPESGK